MRKTANTVNRAPLAGERHPRARLTDGDVELLRQMHEHGHGYRRLARMFEVTTCHVRDIVKYRRR